MTLGPIVLLIYAILMLAGGVLGYLKAGSRPSLIAGGTSGILLLVAYAVTFRDMGLGLWIGAVIAGLLCVVTGMRWVKSKKMMPSGMLAIISLLSLALLLRSAMATPV